MGIREMLYELLSRFKRGVELPEFPPLPEPPKARIDERRARDLEARLNRLALQQRLAEARYRDAAEHSDE